MPWLYFRIKFLQNFWFIFERIDTTEDLFPNWLTRDSSWTSSFEFRCFIMSVAHRKRHCWTIIWIWNWHWKLMIEKYVLKYFPMQITLGCWGGLVSLQTILTSQVLYNPWKKCINLRLFSLLSLFWGHWYQRTFKIQQPWKIEFEIGIWNW